MKSASENKVIKIVPKNKGSLECPTSDDLPFGDLSVEEFKARRELKVKRERRKKWRSAS